MSAMFGFRNVRPSVSLRRRAVRPRAQRRTDRRERRGEGRAERLACRRDVVFAGGSSFCCSAHPNQEGSTFAGRETPRMPSGGGGKAWRNPTLRAPLGLLFIVVQLLFTFSRTRACRSPIRCCSDDCCHMGCTARASPPNPFGRTAVSCESINREIVRPRVLRAVLSEAARRAVHLLWLPPLGAHGRAPLLYTSPRQAWKGGEGTRHVGSSAAHRSILRRAPSFFSPSHSRRILRHIGAETTCGCFNVFFWFSESLVGWRCRGGFRVERRGSHMHP